MSRSLNYYDIVGVWEIVTDGEESKRYDKRELIKKLRDAADKVNHTVSSKPVNSQPESYAKYIDEYMEKYKYLFFLASGEAIMSSSAEYYEYGSTVYKVEILNNEQSDSSYIFFKYNDKGLEKTFFHKVSFEGNVLKVKGFLTDIHKKVCDAEYRRVGG